MLVQNLQFRVLILPKMFINNTIPKLSQKFIQHAMQIYFALYTDLVAKVTITKKNK
jgi:hypothetical protein